MEEVVKNLQQAMLQISDYIRTTAESELSVKPNSEKWSKKEILGHLLDSGIYNLQRFTEIQFKEKPFRIKAYEQDELVKANNYQDAQTNHILNMLIAVNKRIIEMIKLQTDETLNYKIVTSENNMEFDLKYLIHDYVSHFKHHTKQIIE